MFAARTLAGGRVASALGRSATQFLPTSAISYRVAGMATISDAITKDHREIERYVKEVVTSIDPDHQQRYGNQFTWELARHAVGEELLVYPAFEEHLGTEGKAMAETDRQAHRKMKELLKEFQNMSAIDSGYVAKLEEIWGPLREHMVTEEEKNLPALERALGKEESESLSDKFGRTKNFVPTRSHPNAGEHPPFETVVGLMTAPIDKIADAFRKFPAEERKVMR